MFPKKSAGQTVHRPETPAAEITPRSASHPSEVGPINFNDVSIIEYIRFIGRISGRNFIFNDEDLQFRVTIASEEPTSVENLLTALLQELRVRNLSLLEEGNNLLIHKNPTIRSPSRIISEDDAASTPSSSLVTRVFRLNTLDPVKASDILRPLLSPDAQIHVLADSNNLIVTDLTANVEKVAQLVHSLDAPNSGVVIGQYVVKNAFVESLVSLTTQILTPIAQGNPFVLVPNAATNTVYVVANGFLVEKGLAILQAIDLNEGATRILSLDNLRPLSPEAERAMRERGVPWEQEPGGTGIPSKKRSSILPSDEVSSGSQWSTEFPTGHLERTLFFIYKLRYRKGDEIEVALRKIAYSLQMNGRANADLLEVINSSQWIESSNAMIFTGAPQALEKMRELIKEIDVPLRQVFIEMLILDTTISDSLAYGVDWINRFGGGNTVGEQGFFTSTSRVLANAAETITRATPSPSPNGLGIAGGLGGYAGGVIGTHLTHCGLHFSSIGALVRAIHNDTKANILLNPKIITEDNNTAEIFVGGVDRYKTQSITNDNGRLVTNNFQFIDVGTTLRVTPLISNEDTITLEIVQETTKTDPLANQEQYNQLTNDVNLVPVLSKSRTVTRVHVPNGFFVILSGLIEDSESRVSSRTPCWGGIPILGALGKTEGHQDDKRNLMLFIRPLIVDTQEELEEVTKRQQDVYQEKSKARRRLNYEVNEALNFANIKATDPDEQPLPACSCESP